MKLTKKATREALADALRECIEASLPERRTELCEALQLYRAVRPGRSERQKFRVHKMGLMFFKAIDSALED